MDQSALDLSSAQPHLFCTCLMLDRFVFTTDLVDLVDFLADGDPMWGCSVTSLGEFFSVGLLPALPPRVSRLYVRWDRTEGKAIEVVTADQGLFLLRVTTTTLIPYQQDYFVFKTMGEQPLLKRLPICKQPIVLPVGDSEISTKRRFHNNTLGLVSSISYEFESGFVVVQLAKFVDLPGGSRKKGAEICVYRSSFPMGTARSFGEDDGKWDILTLPIHHKEEEFSDLLGWSTDGAIILNHTICWFDYYHGGILLYKPSLGGGDSFIDYVRLPINNRPINSLPSDEKLEMYRSLSVTGKRGSEMLWFVDVSRDDGVFYGPLWNGYTFTITCHTFDPKADQMWLKYDVVTSGELKFIALENLVPPPRNSVPTFPLVSRERPGRIHCLMSEPGNEIDNVSVVDIDISSKAIVLVTPYIRGDIDLCGKDAKMVRHRSRLPWSFLPFQT